MNYNKIIQIVKEAGFIAKDKSLLQDVKSKTESDFVTAVDTGISDFIKEKLSKITPEIGFMSEEEDSEIMSSRWILDPIDGTTNLLYDYNMSSISLALCIDEKIVFGVVYNPFTEEIFTAESGKGAFYNGVKIPPAKDRNLKESLIEFGAGVSKKQHIEANFNIAKEAFKECLDIRRVCSSALVLCYIATGKMNGYFERELKPWDYAAAALIMDECGVKYKNWNGENIQYRYPSSFVAGTPKVIEFLLKTIKKYNN